MMRKTLARIATSVAASLFLLAAGSPTLQANDWEFGFAGGGSIYQEKGFTAPAGSANAGFNNAFSAGAWLGYDLYNHISGEIRYTYGDNDAKLNAGGLDTSFAARSHAVHYDVLIHLSGRESNVRPFFSVGAGAKGFYGTGGESLVQPLQDYAVLSRTSEWKPLVTFGGGVKIKLSKRLRFTGEVKDHFSAFPEKVILPAAGADLGGWIHNVVLMGGIGITF